MYADPKHCRYLFYLVYAEMYGWPMSLDLLCLTNACFTCRIERTKISFPKSINSNKLQINVKIGLIQATVRYRVPVTFLNFLISLLLGGLTSATTTALRHQQIGFYYEMEGRAAFSLTLTMSCWGIPSVIQTMRGISASSASMMAAAAPNQRDGAFEQCCAAGSAPALNPD